MNPIASFFALLCALLLGIIAALIVSFDLLPAILGQVTSNGGGPPGTQVGVMGPLDALAAIDRKIAQGLTFLVFIAGFLPFLLTYLDSQKRRELAEFEEKADQRAQRLENDLKAGLAAFETRWDNSEDRASQHISRFETRFDQREADVRARVADIERHLEVRINDELSSKLKKLEREYAGEVSRLITDLAGTQARAQLAVLAESDVNAELVLFAYIHNDLEGVKVEQHLSHVFRFQQNLRRIASTIESEVYQALNTLNDACGGLSSSTSGFLKQYLVNARDRDLIRSRSNIEMLQKILFQIDAKLRPGK